MATRKRQTATPAHPDVVRRMQAQQELEKAGRKALDLFAEAGRLEGLAPLVQELGYNFCTLARSTRTGLVRLSFYPDGNAYREDPHALAPVRVDVPLRMLDAEALSALEKALADTGPEITLEGLAADVGQMDKEQRASRRQQVTEQRKLLDGKRRDDVHHILRTLRNGSKTLHNLGGEEMRKLLERMGAAGFVSKVSKGVYELTEAGAAAAKTA